MGNERELEDMIYHLKHVGRTWCEETGCVAYMNAANRAHASRCEYATRREAVAARKRLLCEGVSVRVYNSPCPNA